MKQMNMKTSKVKLYGAEVSQGYIQYLDNKRRHHRYPRAAEYPYEAAEQERMRDYESYSYYRYR